MNDMAPEMIIARLRAGTADEDDLREVVAWSQRKKAGAPQRRNHQGATELERRKVYGHWLYQQAQAAGMERDDALQYAVDECKTKFKPGADSPVNRHIVKLKHDGNWTKDFIELYWRD